MRWSYLLHTFVLTVLLTCAAHAEPRTVVDLSGTWQIAEGSLGKIPKRFGSKAPVPGLVDMARPPFADVGAVGGQNYRPRPVDPKREAFWYRTTFRIDGSVPPVARLKIHKAKFSARVFLNGHLLGDHGPNFTPGYFNARPHLLGDGQGNELIIRVGAAPSASPATVPWGFDFEKIRYLPGIYDRVELILCDTPHVVNVQTAADLPGRSVRVVVEVANNSKRDVRVPLECTVCEWKTGLMVGGWSDRPITIAAKGKHIFDLTIPISNCRRWTPENPFLYTLEVNTGKDVYRTRFGMRSFSADPKTGRVILNGKPYFMRGTNVCILRFFEDGSRGARPWDEAWVRKLHRRFKDMNWNSIRYCIGFPPESWYDIADEEGFLIQDEYPIFNGRNNWPKEIETNHLAAEWTAWMRERWNHPCVVIWDAQNETTCKAFAEAIGLVRSGDLSNRPWDNGWDEPQSPNHDVTEYHPYRANREKFDLDLFTAESGVPDNGPKPPRQPYIINEYGYMWLNRDGSQTKLAMRYKFYDKQLGENATTAQRREYYARTLAAMTEFWRGRRKCAGVLHFCGLGYSRADGCTSDHFIDMQELKYEPHFYNYVRDAFSEVGVMIDFWKVKLSQKEKQLAVPVVVTNDLYEPWQGELTLVLVAGNRTLWTGRRKITVQPLEQQSIPFTIDLPDRIAKYQLVAKLNNVKGEIIQSVRDLERVTPD